MIGFLGFIQRALKGNSTVRLELGNNGNEQDYGLTLVAGQSRLVVFHNGNVYPFVMSDKVTDFTTEKALEIVQAIKG